MTQLATKPAKPYPDFPLFPHASGKWAKKIKGVLKYFGRWEDPDGALAAYEATITTSDSVSQSPDSSLTVKEGIDRFLASKEEAMNRGELSPRSWRDYLQTTTRVADYFGRATRIATLTPDAFARFKTARESKLGIVAIGNEVTRVKTLFRWLHESRLIPEAMHFGPDFRRASAKALRRHKRETGKKLFTALEVNLILDECGVQLRAMCLLGINCGFGPNDCAKLPVSAVDLDRGWIDYPRPKTEVERLAPLWPETVEALRLVAKQGEKTLRGTEDALVFHQSDGQCWDTSTNPIQKHIRQALWRANIRRGGFYWLRHTFFTVGGGAKDQVALSFIMGHVDATMAAHYREEIGEDRLRAVVDHVRAWLFS